MWIFLFATFINLVEIGSARRAAPVAKSPCKITFIDGQYGLTGMFLLETIYIAVFCSDCRENAKCELLSIKRKGFEGNLKYRIEFNDYSLGHVITFWHRPSGNLPNAQISLSHHGVYNLSVSYSTCSAAQMSNCSNRISSQMCLLLPPSTQNASRTKCGQDFSKLSCDHSIDSTLPIKLPKFEFNETILHACVQNDKQNYAFCNAIRQNKFVSYFASDCSGQALIMYRNKVEFRSTSSFYWNMALETEFKFSCSFDKGVQFNLTYVYVMPMKYLNQQKIDTSDPDQWRRVNSTKISCDGTDIAIKSNAFNLLRAQVMVVLKSLSSKREVLAYFTLNLLTSSAHPQLMPRPIHVENDTEDQGYEMHVKCKHVHLRFACTYSCIWIITANDSKSTKHGFIVAVDSASIEKNTYICNCTIDCIPGAGIYGPWKYRTYATNQLSLSDIQKYWWIILLIVLICILVIALIGAIGFRLFLHIRKKAKMAMYGDAWTKTAALGAFDGPPTATSSTSKKSKSKKSG